MKRYETAASALLLASSLVLPASGQAPKTDAAKIANALGAAPPRRVAQR